MDTLLSLVESARRVDRLRALTDAELADKVLVDLWAKYPLHTVEGDLLDVVMERLNGASSRTRHCA